MDNIASYYAALSRVTARDQRAVVVTGGVGFLGSPRVELAAGLRRTIAYFDQPIRIDYLDQAKGQPYTDHASRALPDLVREAL